MAYVYPLLRHPLYKCASMSASDAVLLEGLDHILSSCKQNEDCKLYLTLLKVYTYMLLHKHGLEPRVDAATKRPFPITTHDVARVRKLRHYVWMLGLEFPCLEDTWEVLLTVFQSLLPYLGIPHLAECHLIYLYASRLLTDKRTRDWVAPLLGEFSDLIFRAVVWLNEERKLGKPNTPILSLPATATALKLSRNRPKPATLEEGRAQLRTSTQRVAQALDEKRDDDDEDDSGQAMARAMITAINQRLEQKQQASDSGDSMAHVEVGRHRLAGSAVVCKLPEDSRMAQHDNALPKPDADTGLTVSFKLTGQGQRCVVGRDLVTAGASRVTLFVSPANVAAYLAACSLGRVLEKHLAIDEDELRPQLPDARACGNCSRRFEASFRKCGRCLVMHYCERKCQVAHWDRHKSDCAIFQHFAKTGQRLQILRLS